MPDSIALCGSVTLWPCHLVHEWSIDMRLTTTLAAAAAIAVSGVAATAGGMSEPMEAPVVMVDPAPEPTTSSVSPTYVILGVLAAILIAAAAAKD